MSKIPDKRKAIFNATLKLVSKFGFHGTSMSMISKEAKVSAGIIYHYFKSKDELIVALYKEIKNKIATAIPVNNNEEQPLRKRVWNYWNKIIRYQFENPSESAFLDQFNKSPYYNEKIEMEVLEYYKPHLELVEQAKKEMIIKDLPLIIYHTFSVDVASSISQKSQIGMIELTEDLIKIIVDASWEAIKL